MATNFYNEASLVLIPSGYKAGKLYSIKPTNGDGDFTFARAAGYSSRNNSVGLIESVADNTPRLQYPKCPALLLEPSRVNGLFRSEEFDNVTDWTLLNSTINANATTSPDGTQNADELIDDATVGGHQVYQNVNPTPTGGEQYVFSVFAKANTIEWVCMSLQIDGTFNRDSFFNLNTQTWGVISTYIDDYGYEDWGNGWYRVWIAFTQTSAGNSRHSIVTSKDGVSKSYGGTGESLFIWGAVSEQGAYPTTYIKTEGSAVTRADEILSLTGLQTNGILSADTGSWFIHFNDVISPDIISLVVWMWLGDALNTNSIQFQTDTDQPLLKLQGYPGPVVLNTTPLVASNARVAITWDGVDLRISANGELLATVLNATFAPSAFPNFSSRIEANVGLQLLIQEMLMFPTKLTDQELFDLTNPQWTTYSQMATELNYTVI